MIQEEKYERLDIEDDYLHDRQLIKMAAMGCISGTLDDWPDLNRALCRLGIRLPVDTESPTLTEICRLVPSKGE